MREWHHAPPHRFDEAGTYFITGATYGKEHFLRGSNRLDLFSEILFSYLEAADVELEAWALFSNHYHLVARSGEDPGGLRKALGNAHSLSSNRLNALDGTRGRKVWYQYWDTRLTFEKSYYPRLRYVHENPVRHGLVRVASQYPWCSAGWFETRAERSFQRKLSTFRIDRLNVADPYDPVLDED